MLVYAHGILGGIVVLIIIQVYLRGIYECVQYTTTYTYHR